MPGRRLRSDRRCPDSLPAAADDGLRAAAAEGEVLAGGEPDHVVLRGELTAAIAHAVDDAVPDDLRADRQAGGLNGCPEDFLHVPATETRQGAAGVQDAGGFSKPPDERVLVVRDAIAVLGPPLGAARLVVDPIRRIATNDVNAAGGERRQHGHAVAVVHTPATATFNDIYDSPGRLTVHCLSCFPCLAIVVRP